MIVIKYFFLNNISTEISLICPVPVWCLATKFKKTIFVIITKLFVKINKLVLYF